VNDAPTPLHELPHPEAEAESRGFRVQDLLDYMMVLRQHLLLFLVLTIITAAGVTALGLSQQKVYRSSTTVLVNYKPPTVLKEGDDVYQLSHHIWEYVRYLETQPSVIESREVLQAVVQDLGLAEDEDFLGIAEMEPGDEKEVARSRKDPVTLLRKRVDVEIMTDSMAITIHVSDTDPGRAADIANAMADAYIEYYRQARLDATSDASEWLKERVGQLTTQVQAAEDDLLRFREENDFVGTSLEDSLNLTSEKLLLLNDAATRKEIEYVEQRTRWEQAQLMIEEGRKDSIPQVLANQSIQDLKQELFTLASEEGELAARYGEKQPELVRATARRERVESEIQAEIDTIIDGLRAEMVSHETTLDQLQAQLDHQRGIALQLSRKELLFKRLERDLTQTQTVYDSVKDRSLEAELAGMLESSNISVLDRATKPRKPSEPKPQLVLLVAIALGLGAGVGGAFVADRLDSTVRAHGQLEAEFKLPVIGIYPRVDEEEVQAENPLYIAREQKSAAAESVRTIRTNLMFMSPGEEITSLVVTSAGPSEGKTSLAANIAYTMASAGKRVVLVDTDMRRPRVHKAFGLKKQLGLSSALIGEISREEAVRPSGYPNLDLLPLGNVPPNPAELLASVSFNKMCEWLFARYDRVIFDSPPVMAVADASILAQHVDGILLVARQDKTNRHMLRQSLNSLATVNAKVLGFVLNDLDLNAASRGYYGYRYRYRYPYHHYSYRYYRQYSEEEEDTVDSQVG